MKPDAPRHIPYGRQSIEDDDVEAVVAALRSDWLTTGPRVEEFEQAVCALTGAKQAVAVCNGTAALHAAVAALGIGPGDEVIVPALTFAASANCVVYQGGTPVFADVDADTLLLDPRSAESKITPRTRAIVAVDYAGQPCDYDALRAVAGPAIRLVADACHAIGGRLGERAVGTLADLNTFSFHPVKHVTTAEGGMITTADAELALRMRTFRNHGITTDHRQRERQGSFFYEMTGLGYNYRLSDIQCALGTSQLRKLRRWVERRQAIAARYDAAFAACAEFVAPQRVRPGVSHAYHLYVVRLQQERLSTDRAAIFAALRGAGLGVNVHYLPVHLHPFYRERFGTRPGQCPVAERAYEGLLSLPMFPAMSDADVDYVIETVTGLLRSHAR